MTSETTFRHLLYERRASAAVITLNRPEVLNACAPATHCEVQAAITRAEDENAVRAIVLAGAGRAFCSGSDLREVGKLTGAAARDYLKLDFETKNRVAACTKPVIAVLHGHVAGGGFELALACDIRLAAEDVLFSLPEITLGTIPGSGGLQRLPQMVGLGVAKEWVMTGRRIDAQEAFRTGLVNHVYSKEAVMDAALELAAVLAEKSALALSLAKVALDPEPPAGHGLVGAYHRLASQACHDDPMYERRAMRHGGQAQRDG